MCFKDDTFTYTMTSEREVMMNIIWNSRQREKADWEKGKMDVVFSFESTVSWMEE